MFANDGKKGLFVRGLDYTPELKKEHISFRDVWLFIKRHLVWLATSAAVGVGLGTLFILNATPEYLAVSRVVMDPGQAKIASQDEVSGTIIIESAEIASQVQIVKSESVALTVIEQLNLVNDPELGSSSSWRGKVRRLIYSAAETLGVKEPDVEEELTEEQLLRRTMAGFLGRVTASRVGQSYVLEIGYLSADPNHAAHVANTTAQAYIQTGMADRRNAARQGATWLEERLVEISNRARESQLAVEEYRASKGLTSVGTESALDHQQLVETSSQLLAARAETAIQLARLETIRKLEAGEVVDGEIDDSLTNRTVLNLRDEIRAAKSRYDAVKQRYRPENVAVLSAKSAVETLQAELQIEFLRIEDVYQSNLEIARARERILTTKLTELRDEGVDNNLARVDLAELESRAATYRRMYETLLQQLIGALQFESFPLGTARVVAAATPPTSKASPKTSLILPMSMLLGLGIGFLIVAWRELMDRRLGTGSKLARELGISLLGNVPLRSTDSLWQKLGKGGKFPSHYSVSGAVLNSPYSDFSESLRDIKFSIDSANTSGDKGMVIGIASERNGDGKTTVAVNLAQLYFNEGIDTVLVDADFQKGILTKLATDSSSVEKLALAELGQECSNLGSDDMPEEDFEPHLGRRSGARLPVATLNEIHRFNNINEPHRLYWHLPALNTRLAELKAKHSVIIVDMSSFSTSSDARSVCGMVDGIIIVVGTPRSTTLDSLSESLSRFGNKPMNVLGVVVNRARKEKVRSDPRPPGALLN